MVNLFNSRKVLIIGDVMVDSYINGKMNRISPEAPVPVVSVTNREERLGGAANVALNVQALGAIPKLCSVVGNDKIGERFMTLLEKARIATDGIITIENRTTTVKHRVMSGNHHVIRIDEETEEELDSVARVKLHGFIDELMDDCDIVIIEDYDKGLLCKETIDYVRQKAESKGIGVVVDPKKKNFEYYTNLTLFKPNFKELQEGIGRTVNSQNLDEVKKAVEDLHQMMQCEAVMVTLSEKGIMIKDKQELTHHLAHYREISDVSGAGDTVIAVAALALACDQSLSDVAAIANLAGGLVCEHHGVVPIDRKQLAEEWDGRG